MRTPRDAKKLAPARLAWLSARPGGSSSPPPTVGVRRPTLHGRNGACSRNFHTGDHRARAPAEQLARGRRSRRKTQQMLGTVSPPRIVGRRRRRYRFTGEQQQIRRSREPDPRPADRGPLACTSREQPAPRTLEPAPRRSRLLVVLGVLLLGWECVHEERRRRKGRRADAGEVARRAAAAYRPASGWAAS